MQEFYLSYLVNVNAEDSIQNTINSDALLFRLFSQGNLVSARGNSKVSRVIQTSDPDSELTVDYLIGQSKLNFPDINLPTEDIFDNSSCKENLYDFLYDYALVTRNCISEAIRKALYSKMIIGNPEILGLPELINTNPKNGILYGHDRSNKKSLQNLVLTNQNTKFTHKLAPSKSDILLVDNARFDSLLKTLSPRRIVGKKDMLSAGFKSFIWNGREVITPSIDVIDQNSYSYYLSSESMEIALDTTAIGKLNFEKRGSILKQTYIDFGMQVMFNSFESNAVAT